MNRKVQVGCVCLAAVLLLMPIARGDILQSTDFSSYVYWGDHVWPCPGYFTSYTSGYSNGDDYDNLGGAQGSFSIYTTEAGDFHWWSYCSGRAAVALQLWDGGTSYAEAWGWFSWDDPGGAGENMGHALVEDGDTRGQWWEYETDPPVVRYADDTMYGTHFDAMQGISLENIALVWVTVHDGGQDYGDASAEARTSASMTPVE
jgi:hypothetical protein